MPSELNKITFSALGLTGGAAETPTVGATSNPLARLTANKTMSLRFIIDLPLSRSRTDPRTLGEPRRLRFPISSIVVKKGRGRKGKKAFGDEEALVRRGPTQVGLTGQPGGPSDHPIR